MIDLHVHSTMSDGTFTPREIAFYAKAKGLSAIALTDHDTTSGVVECQQNGDLVGLTVIPGIEISSDYHGTEVHILGYFIDINNQMFQNKLLELKNRRNNRNSIMLERLQAQGCNITMDDIAEFITKDKTVITRPHFARALIKKGYVKTVDEAFDKYIGRGCPAYVSREFIDYRECIDLIHTAGGIASIAHSTLYPFDEQQFTKFLDDLLLAGIDCIESIYPEYSYAQTKFFLDFCKQHNLLITGGSDFHGDNKPSLDIGSGFGATYVADSVLVNMKQKIKEIRNDIK
ncbi:MAG: hypothetical protein ATN35_04575 [Epulopiscium sp. Nele67-Bin004]|nr:MAG: hypothetical protein ATN35_04575 [Epulopiscium sp. Nele67-Bin004]